jgi:hypothetical protein
MDLSLALTRDSAGTYACQVSCVPPGHASISPLFPGLNAPGYCRTPLWGSD